MGMKLSSSLKRHLTVLEETVVLFNSLVTEIEFSKAEITKILGRFSDEPSMKTLSFLRGFKETGDYDDFHALWSEAVSAFPYYKREEKEKMLQLGTFLGTTDVNNQMSMIRLYLNCFGEYRERARSEYEKQGRIYSLLGLFIGASAYILIL